MRCDHGRPAGAGPGFSLVSLLSAGSEAFLGGAPACDKHRALWSIVQVGVSTR